MACCQHRLATAAPIDNRSPDTFDHEPTGSRRTAPSRQRPTRRLARDNLHKRYDDKEVVCGIDFSVPRGTCFIARAERCRQDDDTALLLGLTAPNAGDIRLNGFSVPSNAARAREQVGVVPQFDNPIRTSP